MCFALSKFKNRNNLYVLFNKLIKVAFVCFAALLVLSCGGGGGGGGMVAFQSEPQMHNGGDAGGWGSTGGGSFSSGSSDGLLFEAFPPFFSPIDHIDMSLMVNGSPVELTGLNESTPSDVLDVSNGDQISGSAVITLADGTTRNATLSTTTIGLTNKLALVVTYQYELVDGAGNESSISGEYTSSGGINVMDISWTSSAVGGTFISGWKSDSGVTYPAGGTITGLKGDVKLTSRYSLGLGSYDTVFYRYGTGSGLIDSTSINVTGGSGTYTAVSSSPALTATVSGSTVSVAVDSTYGSTAGQTVADTATASGAAITITISDGNGSSEDATIYLRDCVSINAAGRVAQNTNISGITSVTIPNSGVVNGVDIGTGIPSDAFRNNTSITTLELPPTIISIYSGTYSDYTPQGAFSDSAIQTLTAPGLQSIGAAAFANTQISSLDWDNVTNIQMGAFANCTSLASADLSHITSGGFNNYAFKGCSNLSTVTWGSYGQVNIPAHAFEGAMLSNNVISSIPSGVYSISQYAFSDCSGLSTITIPSTVTFIDSFAFTGCSNLSSVVFDSDPASPESRSVGTYCFSGCTSLESVTLPRETSFSLPASVFNMCSGLKEIVTTGTNFTASTMSMSSTILQHCTGFNTLDLESCTTVEIPAAMLIYTTDAITLKLGTGLTSLRLTGNSLGGNQLQQPLIITYAGSATQWKNALNTSGATVIQDPDCWGTGTITVTCSSGGTVTWNGSSWN